MVGSSQPMGEGNCMIHCSELCRSYATGKREISVIRSLDLSILAGERAAIVGKSGSGKSTLLNLLAGLDRPSSGELTIDSYRLDRLSRAEMAQFRLQKVGVIFQAFQLIPQRTAIQNVELPLILKGETRAIRRQVALNALDRVGLLDRANHFPFQLSGGEQQRVAIARALVNQPKLILADEPTGNLDSGTAEKIVELLIEIFREFKTTVILVTHDQEMADRVSDRQFQMQDGVLKEFSKESRSNDVPL